MGLTWKLLLWGWGMKHKQITQKFCNLISAIEEESVKECYIDQLEPNHNFQIEKIKILILYLRDTNVLSDCLISSSMWYRNHLYNSWQAVSHEVCFWVLSVTGNSLAHNSAHFFTDQWWWLKGIPWSEQKSASLKFSNTNSLSGPSTLAESLSKKFSS